VAHADASPPAPPSRKRQYRNRFWLMPVCDANSRPDRPLDACSSSARAPFDSVQYPNAPSARASFSSMSSSVLVTGAVYGSGPHRWKAPSYRTFTEQKSGKARHETIVDSRTLAGRAASLERTNRPRALPRREAPSDCNALLGEAYLLRPRDQYLTACNSPKHRRRDDWRASPLATSSIRLIY